MASLVPAEPMVVVLAGEVSGRTKISFDPSPARYFQLFLRVTNPSGLFGPWKEISLSSVTQNNATGAGTFRTPGILPGQIVDFVMLRATAPGQVIDPERAIAMNEIVLARAQVVAIRETVRIEKPDWLRDGRKEVGGTYYLRELIANEPFIASLRLSQQQPTEKDDYTGSFVMANELNWNTIVFATSHVMQAVPLNPGSTWFCVVRLIDTNGAAFEFLDGPAGTGVFTCLRRKVSVSWDDVVFTIVDESSAEPNVRFSVWEENSLVGDKQEQWTGIASGNKRVVAAKWDIGPKAMNWNASIQAGSQGTEYDGGLFDPSERTPMVRTPIVCPAGFGLEKVSGTSAIQARDPEGDFEFLANFTYSVEYVP